MKADGSLVQGGNTFVGFCLLQGFVPVVVPDMLKGAVFVSCMIMTSQH